MASEIGSLEGIEVFFKSLAERLNSVERCAILNFVHWGAITILRSKWLCLIGRIVVVTQERGPSDLNNVGWFLRIHSTPESALLCSEEG